MIEADETVFPNNIVEHVALRLSLIDAEVPVYRRPLRATDSPQAFGVTAAQWAPVKESMEMRGTNSGLETLSRYLVTIQGIVLDMDEDRGLAAHSTMSMMIRNIVYRDGLFVQGLAELTSTLLGVTERTQRWGIQQQRFFSNDINGQWIYLSNLEFWLETENT